MKNNIYKFEYHVQAPRRMSFVDVEVQFTENNTVKQSVAQFERASYIGEGAFGSVGFFSSINFDLFAKGLIPAGYAVKKPSDQGKDIEWNNIRRSALRFNQANPTSFPAVLLAIDKNNQTIQIDLDSKNDLTQCNYETYRLLMPKLGEMDLDKYVLQQPIDLKILSEVFYLLAIKLNTLHIQHNCVHGDVRDPNIRLKIENGKPSVYLIDFDLTEDLGELQKGFGKLDPKTYSHVAPERQYKNDNRNRANPNQDFYGLADVIKRSIYSLSFAHKNFILEFLESARRKEPLHRPSSNIFIAHLLFLKALYSAQDVQEKNQLLLEIKPYLVGVPHHAITKFLDRWYKEIINIDHVFERDEPLFIEALNFVIKTSLNNTIDRAKQLKAKSKQYNEPIRTRFENFLDSKIIRLSFNQKVQDLLKGLSNILYLDIDKLRNKNSFSDIYTATKNAVICSTDIPIAIQMNLILLTALYHTSPKEKSIVINTFGLQLQNYHSKYKGWLKTGRATKTIRDFEELKQQTQLLSQGSIPSSAIAAVIQMSSERESTLREGLYKNNRMEFFKHVLSGKVFSVEEEKRLSATEKTIRDIVNSMK